MMKAASGVVLMVLLSLTLTVLAQYGSDHVYSTHDSASGAHDSLLTHANEPSHADAIAQASHLVHDTHNRNTDDEEDSMYEPARTTEPTVPPSKTAQSPNACSGVPYDFSTSNYCQANKFTAATYPAAPAGMVLRSLQLITRHGDRVPVSILPHYDVAFELCGTTASQGFYTNPTPSNERNAAAGEMGHRKPHAHHRPRRSPQGTEGRRLEQIPYLVAPSTTNPFGAGLWQGSCATGQLTTVGIAQHNALGSALREIYVDTLGFLPTDYSRANNSFYLRSTDVWRTRQSAESLLTGLWPAASEDLDSADVIPFHSFPVEIETMFPNFACSALGPLVAAEYATDAWVSHMRDYPEIWAELDGVLGVGALKDWHLGYDHFVDNFRVRECHGLPLPCSVTNSSYCISPATAQFVFDQGDWEYRYLMNESPQANAAVQLGIGGFMAVIRDLLAAVVSGDASGSTIGAPAFAYYSGHDTTLSAVLGFMNVTGMKWPPYASNMLIELWEKPQMAAAAAAATPAPSNDPAAYAVRILYNGGVLRLFAAGCCEDLCPYEQLAAYFDSMIPVNLVSMCAPPPPNATAHAKKQH